MVVIVFHFENALKGQPDLDEAESDDECSIIKLNVWLNLEDLNKEDRIEDELDES